MTGPMLKLGKAEAKRDSRNLKFAAIRKAIKPPPRYDFDEAHPGVPLPMFKNDELGCCVIAGRAHQTLRLELLEQGSVLPITDEDVTKEYFRQTRGQDSGLVVLDSLRQWRTRGWDAARKRYRIEAFAEVNRADLDEVRAAIFAHVGIGIGLALPLSAKDQLDAKLHWMPQTGPRGVKNTWGGHYVYVPAYNEIGPICITWGARQQMTWEFFLEVCDEAYFMVDALDSAPKIDRDVVIAHVEEVSPTTLWGRIRRWWRESW